MQKVLRFAILVILYLLILNSIVFMGLSVYKSIHAYVVLAQGRLEEKPGILIAESLDGLLIALVFILFSIGIARFFLPNSNFLKGYDLPWLKLDSFSTPN